MCVCERERDSERERGRENENERERNRQRERENGRQIITSLYSPDIWTSLLSHDECKSVPL